MMYIIAFLAVLQASLFIMSSGDHHQHPWCPPTNFVSQRAKTTRQVKTVLITEIHGQLVTTGYHWGIFMPGVLLARNLHYHVGVLGFDKVYINIIYNDTVHPTPPLVTELYPADKSCVAAWHATGVVELRYAPYAGDKSRWPLDKGVPSLDKDLYKTLRGVNPIYAEVMQRREADWVAVLDADEYLVPINWKPSRSDWCSPRYPSVLELGTQQMLITATTVNLEDFPHLLQTKGQVARNASEACVLGYGISTAHGYPPCREISSIILPVKLWIKQSRDGVRKPRMPLMRARVPSSYPHNEELNKTEVHAEHQYHQWKSMHQTRFTPLLQGTKTMHYGHHDAFKVIAPRDFHEGISFEIAHVQQFCDDECQDLLVRDEALNDLSLSYYRCMSTLN